MATTLSIISCILTFLSISASVFGDVSPESSSLIACNEPSFAKYNFTQMANALDLPCEEHHVTTEDGYILTIFHIPGNWSNILFYVAGVVDSPDAFIVRARCSVAFTMAQQGYDQWFASPRGTQYSQKHVYLDPEKDKKAFWDFSIEELALIDLKTMIDYTLRSTKQNTITGIGHSQGTALFFALGSEIPEYNDKVNLLIAMAPVAYFTHVQGYNKVLFKSFPLLKAVFDVFNQQRFMPPGLNFLIRSVCCIKDVGYDVCVRGLFFPIFGFDEEELEPEFLKIISGHFPISPSVKNFDQLTQISRSHRFAKYDYGVAENMKKYGSVNPPEYPLKNVTMPVALIAAKNDYLSNQKDVQRLFDELPNVVEYHIMERKLFNHANYNWGRHMPKYLFPLLNKLLQEKRRII